VGFFHGFWALFWTIFGPILERFRPENSQKCSNFFRALRAPNFEKKKGVH